MAQDFIHPQGLGILVWVRGLIDGNQRTVEWKLDFCWGFTGIELPRAHRGLGFGMRDDRVYLQP